MIGKQLDKKRGGATGEQFISDCISAIYGSHCEQSFLNTYLAKKLYKKSPRKTTNLMKICSKNRINICEMKFSFFKKKFTNGFNEKQYISKIVLNTLKNT